MGTNHKMHLAMGGKKTNKLLYTQWVLSGILQLVEPIKSPRTPHYYRRRKFPKTKVEPCMHNRNPKCGITRRKELTFTREPKRKVPTK